MSGGDLRDRPVVDESTNGRDWRARRQVASRRTGLPLKVAQTLALDENPWVRLALVEHQRELPDGVVARLADDEDLMVVAGVARYCVVDEATTERFADDPRPPVRRALAAADRPLPPHLLARLARDEDSVVREMVAGRTDLAPELVEVLLADHRWNVREAAAQARRAPATTTTAAAPGHSEVDAADDAANLAAMAADADRSVRLGLARRESPLPEAVLVALAADADALVRHAVAARRQPLPPAVTDRLAADPDWPVRKQLASRADLSPAQRDLLAADEHDQVRAALDASA